MKNKYPGSFFILVISLIILMVGFSIVNSVTNSIDGTNDINNATVGSTNTFYSIAPGMVILCFLVLIIGFASWYVSSDERYQITNKHISNIVAFLNTTTHYFAYGLFAYAIFGTAAVCMYLAYRLSLVAGETGIGIEIGKWLLIIVVLYFVTAGIGYLFKRYIWNKYQDRKAEAKRISLFKELPGANND